jgi:hypothetical protein
MQTKFVKELGERRKELSSQPKMQQLKKDDTGLFKGPTA